MIAVTLHTHTLGVFFKYTLTAFELECDCDGSDGIWLCRNKRRLARETREQSAHRCRCPGAMKFLLPETHSVASYLAVNTG